MFENRRLIIATKHGKENVIAPILERALGVHCFVDAAFDTDVLGTFTGEVERELDPVSTAREKCLRAMQANNCDLGIASEGSFGPHPSMVFVNADDEILIFIDSKNKIEIVVREVSVDTNFNERVIATKAELLDFAKQAAFPEHALILRKSKNSNADIHKGIQDISVLENTFTELRQKYPVVYAETDMRAMHNPKRMMVIAAAAEKIVQQIQSVCPDCGQPGFGVTDVRRGLICSICFSPTNSVLSYVYSCVQCGCTKEEMYPNNKMMEDPMYCDSCNP